MAIRHMFDFVPTGNASWFIVAGEAILFVSGLLASVRLPLRQAGWIPAALLIAVAAPIGLSLVVGAAALNDIHAALTCCPGPHGLGSLLVLVVLLLIDFAALLIYVPLALLVRWLPRPDRLAVWPSVRVGLILATLAAGFSVVLAPIYFQEIGTSVSAAKSILVLVIGSALLAALPFAVGHAQIQKLIGRITVWHVGLALTIVAAAVAYQSIDYPPDDPAAYSEAHSRSIRVIAPPGRADLAQEVRNYQAAWDRIRSQPGTPELTFEVQFDGVAPLRPHRPAVGEWEVDVHVAETPQERLSDFTYVVSEIVGGYSSTTIR